MSAATAVTKLAESAIRGGILQYWSCLLTTTALTAAQQGIDTVAIPGALAGDIAFVSGEAPLAGLQIQGAKVTATDVVSIYTQSNWLTALATSAQVLQICIIKRGKGADSTSA